MSWWALLPGAVALVVLWLLPGWVVLRLLGARRGIVTLGAAPAATSGLVSAYLRALAGVDVVFPQLGIVQGESAAVLADSFGDLHTDPAVCAAVRDLGVTHVYTDTAGAQDGAKVHPRTGALRDVDTSVGFTPVDSGGTATLWQLDACTP